MTAIHKMMAWLDNRDRHSGKIRKAELRYIRTKAHELYEEEQKRKCLYCGEPTNCDMAYPHPHCANPQFGKLGQWDKLR